MEGATECFCLPDKPRQNQKGQFPLRASQGLWSNFNTRKDANVQRPRSSTSIRQRYIQDSRGLNINEAPSWRLNNTRPHITKRDPSQNVLVINSSIVENHEIEFSLSFIKLHVCYSSLIHQYLLDVLPTSDENLGELAVDELESSLTVFLTISLVYVGVVSIRAVRIGRVAVRLDSACVCRTSVARRSWVELIQTLSV